MNDNTLTSSDMPLIERIAEEILARQRAGEQPTVEEYCRRYPEHADELRSFLPAVMAVEGLKPGSKDVSGTFGGTIDIAGKPRETIGDYRILRELGRGGMGIVYEAEQKSLGRHVALKVLLRSTAGDAKGAKRFESEARAAARMHHTNIVPVFDVGSDDEHMFYAMQLIQGQAIDLVIDDLKVLRQASRNDAPRNPTADPRDKSIAHSLVSGEFQQGRLLDERLDQENDVTIVDAVSDRTNATAERQSGSSSAILPGRADLSSAEGDRPAYFLSVARIGHQTADALDYAHARGIIHRDIKPSNLLLDGNGTVWITDFGLAKTGDHGMTHTGDILGTIRYMSPERFEGRCDVRGDVYSLGLTLYELLTLQPAYSASDQLKLIDKIVKTEPPTPRSLDSSVPRDLETIVLKCIDKDVRRRYPSALELRDDLERFINDEPVKARRVSLVERSLRWSRRNKALATSFAVAAILLLIINVAGPLMTWRMAKLKDDAVSAGKLADERAERAVKAEALATHRAELIRQNLYVANMNLGAQMAMTRGSVGRIKDLTDPWISEPAPSDLRGWEWYYLRSRLHQDELTIQPPTDQRSHAFNPDVTAVATADENAIQIWELSTGNLLATCNVNASVLKVAWHPDGRQIAASLDNESHGLVQVWDTDTEKELATFDVPGKSVFGLKFSRDGTRLAIKNDSIKIVDLESREELDLDITPEILAKYRYAGGRGYFSVAWRPDGKRIASLNQGKVGIWDTTSGERISELNCLGRSIVWSPDGERIAAIAGDDIFVWNVEGEISHRVLRGHTTMIRGMAWKPDGKCLASSGADHTVRIWNTDTWTTQRVLQGHTQPIGTVAWSATGDEIASASDDGIIKVWSTTRDGQPPSSNPGWTTAVWGPKSMQDLLVIAGQDGKIRIWDSRDDRLVHTLSTEAVGQKIVTMSADGRYVAMAGHRVSWQIRGELQVWDLESSERLSCRVRNEGKPISAVEWSPCQQVLAVGIGSTVELWAVETLNHEGDAEITFQNLATYTLDDDLTFSANAVERKALRNDVSRNSFQRRNGKLVRVLSWSKDGSQLAIGHQDGSVGIWNPTTDQRKQLKGHEINLKAISWSPSGNSLVSCTRRASIVWDTEKCEERFRLQGHTHHMLWVDWSPQENRIATANRDTSVKVWDADTGQEMITLTGHGMEVRSVEWSPDGQRLASSSADGVTKIWDARKGFKHRSISLPNTNTNQQVYVD